MHTGVRGCSWRCIQSFFLSLSHYYALLVTRHVTAMWHTPRAHRDTHLPPVRFLLSVYSIIPPAAVSIHQKKWTVRQTSAPFIYHFINNSSSNGGLCPELKVFFLKIYVVCKSFSFDGFSFQKKKLRAFFKWMRIDRMPSIFKILIESRQILMNDFVFWKVVFLLLEMECFLPKSGKCLYIESNDIIKLVFVSYCLLRGDYIITTAWRRWKFINASGPYFTHTQTVRFLSWSSLNWAHI